MEAPAPGAPQAARLHARGIQQQHAESRRSHHPGHEQCAALHEGARQPHAGSVCVWQHSQGISAVLM